jgi:hypothetical protein
MPTEIRLYHSKKRNDAYWVLVLKSERAKLYDDRDELVEDWSLDEVLKVFKMPSFWESRKKFGLMVDGKVVDYETDVRDLRTLQDYFDRAYVVLNPDAAAKKMMKALGCIIGGAILTAIGIWILSEFWDNQGRKLKIMPLIIGVVLVIYGFIRIFDYPYWRRLERKIHSEPEEDEEPPRERRRQPDADDEERVDRKSRRYDERDDRDRKR